ncbi:hypothetical protein B0H34DRAFT_100331 [Crassisporium funariophilum]|nr:hypothetical protein B0H34DRAFT_100331 [Crassisporium funariophilum]
MDSRLPPPSGAPPSYAFVTRVYRRNLRPVVITVAFLAGIWTLFSGVGFFRNAPVYNSKDAPKLGLISYILGALYIGVCLIEAFGVFAAATQKLIPVRIYAYLSMLVALIVIAAGLMRTVVHFSLKDDIINTCTQFATGDTVIFTGVFGPIDGGTLTRSQAAAWCDRAWSRDSWSEVVAFLVTSVLAAFFAVVAFAYFRQVLDPTSPANASREPAQHRMGAFPSHYNPPYNPTAGAPYGSYAAYPPPNGPPPNQDAFVPPYGNEGKPPGYVRGDDYKGGYGDQHKDDPFWGDNERGGPSAEIERDVTSRAGPGPFR